MNESPGERPTDAPSPDIPTRPDGSPDPKARTGVLGWFVHNRVASNLLLLGISVAGFFTVLEVPQEIVPDISSGLIQVRVPFPGAGARIVEETVLVRLEETVRDVPGVEEVVGVAVEGMATLTITLEVGADPGDAYDDVRARVEALSNLPVEAEEPLISEADSEPELLRLALAGDASERSLREAAYVVRDVLSAVDGISNVEIATGRGYEISIELSESAMRRHGLSFDQVAAAIRSDSVDIPGGRVRTPTGETILRTEAQAETAADFRRIPVLALPDGGVVRLGDVATVVDGFEDAPIETRMNGEPTVVLAIKGASGAQALRTTQELREEVARLPLPEEIEVVPWSDFGFQLEDRLGLLVKNGAAGLALIFVVLLLTLSTRLAVWTTIGLPVAFFGAFLLMPALGVTINMLSLFAFILTLGILVDDAIVVGENIQRHMDEGATPADASTSGTRQVLLPATFGVLTTMAAFTPLLGLEGSWGELIGTIPLVVIPVLAFSLVDAAWILPHHIAHGGFRVRPSRLLAKARNAATGALDFLSDRVYQPLLAACLGNRTGTIAASLSALMLTGGFVFGGWTQFETQPSFDSDSITVQVELPVGAAFEETDEVLEVLAESAERTRALILEETGAEVQRTLFTLRGQRLSTGSPFAQAPGGGAANIGQVIMELSPAETRPDIGTGEVAELWESLTPPLPGGATADYLTSLIGGGADLSLRLVADSLDVLEVASADLRRAAFSYAGVTKVYDDLDDGAPEVLVRAAATSETTGASTADLGRQLRQAFYGEEVQRIQRGRDDVRVMLRYPEDARRSYESIAAMRVRTRDGSEVPFAEAADASLQRGFSAIRRVDGRRAVTMDFFVDSDTVSADALLQEMERTVLPELRARHPGLVVEPAGISGELADTFANLGRNAVFGLLLIYTLLAVPLSSWAQPFIIMVAVPFGLLGAVYGHLLLGIDLSILSVFGMVAVVGIVVNDSLVMLDFMNRARREGATAMQAALSAGPLRLRPILLTSVTTFVGLAPLLAETSRQAQVLIPMAASLAFGVLFATLVSLLLVPVVYSLTEDLAEWFRSGSGGLRSAPASAAASGTIPAPVPRDGFS